MLGNNTVTVGDRAVLGNQDGDEVLEGAQAFAMAFQSGCIATRNIRAVLQAKSSPAISVQNIRRMLWACPDNVEPPAERGDDGGW